MKFSYSFSKQLPKDTLYIQSHPDLASIAQTLRLDTTEKASLLAINPTNSRQFKLSLSEIETIISSGRYTVAQTLSGKEFQINARLKELNYLEKHGFAKINTSCLIQINTIQSFAVQSNARLELITCTNHQYLVSRYFANEIKEHLL